MKPKFKKRPSSAAYPAPVKIRRAPGTPTKSQLRAAAVAETAALKSRWNAVINEARTLWPKVHAEELAKVDGNFHVLAGLVQMRCQLGRAEADQQVKAFFAKHGVATKPAVAVVAAVPTNPAIADVSMTAISAPTASTSAAA